MKKHRTVIVAAVLLTAAAVALFLLYTPWGRGALAWAEGADSAPPDSPASAAAGRAPESVPESTPAQSEQDPSAAFWQDSINLKVALFTQTPELPNGCEATSLAMVLDYLGFEADKLALAYDYIPRQDFEYLGYSTICGDPELTYCGDPATDMGFYCFPPALAAGANLFLEAQGSTLRAVDISGADESELVEHLLAGRPVIVWKTLYSLLAETREDLAWLVSGTGEVHVPYVNLHVLVLRGFNADYFYLNDPYGQVIKLERELMLTGFAELGSRALVIVEE